MLESYKLIIFYFVTSLKLIFFPPNYYSIVFPDKTFQFLIQSTYYIMKKKTPMKFLTVFFVYIFLKSTFVHNGIRYQIILRSKGTVS